MDARADELTAMIDADAWTDVADALVESRVVGEVWLRTLALNLTALREHRPAIYDAVRAALATVDVATRTADADATVLEAFDTFEVQRASGGAVCVLGIGDGAIISALAKFAPKLHLDRRQEVDVVEPDAARLAAAMGVADLRRPFADQRFAWYVGEQWADALAGDLIDQPTKMHPQGCCFGGEVRQDLHDAFVDIDARCVAARAERRARVAAYYEQLSDDHLVALFGDQPPRRPRMLMVTSEFTSVLKYSTYDSADAMRALGWDVEVLVEAERWHAIGPPSIEAVLDAYRPDCVFQIDHLRYEWHGAIPARLPFVCWVQDHLANLVTPLAGPTIGERDFVLTGAVYKYVERHGYPRRQCVDMAKVSREPVVPASWDEDGDDLIYVSNCAQPAASILFETSQRLGEIADARVQEIYRDSAAEMTRVYAAGAAIRLDGEVREIVRRIAAAPLPMEAEQFLVDTLIQRLNNALYRHQALEWAGQLADDRGLKLGIYGSKWDKHPTLGKYARGNVEYGPALEALTRQSKVLLQLEPYACFTHQRMLDAVLAGGFTLIRSHPINTLAIRFRDFLDRYAPASADSIADVRVGIDAAERSTFDGLVREMRRFDATADVVNIIRGWHRGGILGDEAHALPHLDEIEFDTREQLAARIERFVNDRAARCRVATAQRGAIQQRLTYKAALGRAMRRVRGLLADSLVSQVAHREAA